MTDYYHKFHIPVMGTGHSVDTPIRIAHLGITSVISLVDDILLEQIRGYYSKKYDLPYTEITGNGEDGRARRTTAYLNMVHGIVRGRMETVRNQPFFQDNDKSRYFELLPDESPLKQDYNRLLNMEAGEERDALEKELTDKMVPGSIDVNIMVKLDRRHYDSEGNLFDDEFSDAKTALKGYAESDLNSAIVFSAGINQRLFNYMTRFPDFYRDESGRIKKRIILKVSDFRSSLIQGKFLAKKGLEVYEFRIESGLNCGGHVFPTNGILLPSLLSEIKEKREELALKFQPLIKKYYEKTGRQYPETALKSSPLITVQGGIGNNGEQLRLILDFGMDMTGWGSPFLLVPEATCVDAPTLEILRRAGREDLYISDVSPLEVPFSNVYGSGSEVWTRKRLEDGRPGSPCVKGFLSFNTEFTEKPICLASRRYQKIKIEEIDKLTVSDEKKKKIRAYYTEKACICDHLGNGALIALGLIDEKDAPQCMCPGANIEWFDKIYTLEEMVDHIYGRCPSLVPPERPHMFAAEIEMYVDYFKKQIEDCSYTPKEIKTIQEFRDNLEKSLDFCMEVAEREPYPGENLASIPPCVEEQKVRMNSIYAVFHDKVANISDQD